MSNFKRVLPVRPTQNGSQANNSVLGALRATSLTSSPSFSARAILPAEILNTILDYVEVPTLLVCARTSRRLQEMVYDDTRWVARLQSMGVWNEGEARKRVEDALKKRSEAQRAAREADEAARRAALAAAGGGINGTSRGGSISAVNKPRKTNTTLFDAGVEEERRRRVAEHETRVQQTRSRQGTIDAGFDAPVLLPTGAHAGPAPATTASRSDPGAALEVLSRLRSIRGQARQEFGKVYACLAPYYLDIARARSHADPLIFHHFREPEQQAQMLAQLHQFARCDYAMGNSEREEKLETIIGIFENAVVREFEQGMQARDVDGRMRKYAHVLVMLNGGTVGIDTYIQNNPVMAERESMEQPAQSLDIDALGGLNLESTRRFFARLAESVDEQCRIIERVFPSTVSVAIPFIDRITDDIITEYVTALLEGAHERDPEIYLRATAGSYEQALRFTVSIRPPSSADPVAFKAEIQKLVSRAFEQHIDLYLQEELSFFKEKAESQVETWEKRLTDEQTSKETFYMSNVNRQADKRDFLTSFRKVIMMPVNAVAAVPSAFTGGSTTTTAAAAAVPRPTDHRTSMAVLNGEAPQQTIARSSTPLPFDRSSSPMPSANITAPTTELAAKALIMNSRLEGIRTLFSIEIALNLIHAAKASLERAALFVKLGGQSGEEAREQCEAIFVQLLHILGDRHVRPGFDRAVTHLSAYNPREISEHSQQGVEPLVTFLELVNVGDLIQQMLDVFYAQELVAHRLADRDEFTSPAIKEKRKFESMLDERVAAGLNKGIDVLMDEVEYLCATLQQPTDFNPGAAKSGAGKAVPEVIDLEPTQTAKRIVGLVSSHVGMLVGSTEKNMLDVFNQEVGVRLFAALCKHIKRQRVSVDGAIRLISDTNHYHAYITSMHNKALSEYFTALRELAQIYLIDAKHAKEIGTIIADQDRYRGIFRAEEVYEFAERRADWFVVKRDVERAMYGMGCVVM